MIPTLLLVGLVLGHWWRLVVPLATIGWVVVLLADGTGSGLHFAVVAGLVAAANLTTGVAVHQGGRLIIRRVTGSRTACPATPPPEAAGQSGPAGS